MQILENETFYRLFCFLSGIVILSLWQKLSPLSQVSQSRFRWRDHFGLLFLGHLLLKLLFPFSAGLWAIYIADHKFGLLHQINLNPWVEMMVAVVMLDLAIYWQHRLFHRIPFFWRLHRVHHFDHQMDLTTGIRFHPFEILVSMVFKFLVVALLGVDLVSLIVFEILLNLFSLFTHANILLPARFDKILRKVLVTPPMHRIHHSVEKDETNSNYGFMLSFWDKIFHSYKERARVENAFIELGLKEFRQAHQKSFWGMLKNPFL